MKKISSKTLGITLSALSLIGIANIARAQTINTNFGTTTPEETASTYIFNGFANENDASPTTLDDAYRELSGITLEMQYLPSMPDTTANERLALADEVNDIAARLAGIQNLLIAFGQLPPAR